MGWMRKLCARRLVECWLAAMLGLALTGQAASGRAWAQSAPATTTVSDTVYRGDGTAAGGTVLVSWPAFTTNAGAAVPAGSTSVTIGAGGALSVALVPNSGSTPMGSYYTVVYHLDDGTVTREYWVIPVSAAAVKLAAIKSTVLPASVAMQTVSKSYVDTAIAQAVTGHPLVTTPGAYVAKTGDTMTGPLQLPGDPVSPLQASDKQYVDEQITAVASGQAQTVKTLPQATQVVAQPPGTALGVNLLNGVEYASQYVTGAGNNGIANAANASDCANGCEIKAEQTYASTEVVATGSLKAKTHVEDARGGSTVETFTNPLTVATPGRNSGREIDVTSTQTAAAVRAATGSQDLFSTGLRIQSNALAGGSNVFPQLLQGQIPYFKTTFSGLDIAGLNYTLGQHVLVPEQQNCFGVGDCLMGALYMYASGGFRDDADEGSHPFDFNLSEDARVFKGTCASGCATGATALQIAATASGGTQGEGRYLLDTTPAKVVTAGTLTGGLATGGTAAGGRHASATFAGTSFAVSTFLQTAATIPTQAANIAPGTVTVPIVTSGQPAGFAGNTAALPAGSGVACISDAAVADGRPQNFETAAYTVVDGTHLQMVLNRPHGTGATIAVGGLCGYGLEQTVDTSAGIRQVFPVIGSTSATALIYAGGQSALAGIQGLTSAYANFNLVIASIARAGGVVTLTTVGNPPADVNGLTLTVSGVADTSYNGSYKISTTGPNTITYANGGPDSSSSGGALTLVTGGYALYPMAEVLSVYNAQTKAVDGAMTLAANTVAWAAGDTVEQPHYFQEAVSADIEYITQTTPRPSRYQSAGVYYQGNNGPGLRGWEIANTTPASQYFGNGGTHTPPSIGFNLLGTWKHSMELQAGEDAAIVTHCNSHGCDRWDSSYDLFQMDTSVGSDRMNYSPATSNLNFYLRGTGYGFTPQAFTAGTINVQTLNAGTVHGLFQGTVAAASLPVFGASGAAHVQGAVPDPGAAAGTTRFLREDGTWALAGQSTVVMAANGYTTNGPANFPQRKNLLGEYLLAEGTGTTAHDTSGNGNDASINGATWEGAADLNFTSTGQFIQLPTPLNAAQTWQFAIYVAPFGTATSPQAPGYGNPGLFGLNPSLLCGTDAQHLCLIANSTYSAKAMRMFAFNTDSTESSEPLTSGWHVVTLICGSNVGGTVTKTRLLYDGGEVGGYLAQGDARTCPTGLTGGNYQIGGSSQYTGTWFVGKVAAAWAWSAPLNVYEAAAASRSALDYIRTKGVTTEYRKPVNAAPVILGGLDSRTFGIGITPATTWLAQMQLTDASYQRVNLGIAGELAYDACPQFDATYGALLGAGSGPAIVVLWGGVNDIQTQWNTPRQLADSLRCMVQKAKAGGARVVLATEISSYANAGQTLGDTGKNALNAILHAEAFGWGIDNLADLASDPHLGADGASANTSCFPDFLHPGPGCEPYITTIMQDAVNELLGATATNRHQSAAATYQEVAGDRYLDLTGTAAQAVTLPACTGYSLPRQMTNLGTAAATVSAASGQVLTGSGSVAAGARAIFLPVPGTGAASGCRWERVE